MLNTIYNKIYSLIAIFEVYEKPLKIVKLWFKRKGLVFTKIRNTNTLVKVSRRNIDLAIRLARILKKVKGQCIISEYKIILNFDSVKLSWDVRKLLSDSYEFDIFWIYSHLIRLNYKIYSCSENYCLIESDDGCRWIIRKDVPDDLRIAVLLPYLHESREYHEFFVRYLDKINMFIDIGAYIGGYTIRACRKGKHVIAVEMHPETFNILMKNIEINNCKNNARVFNVAAGAKEGTIPYYVLPKGNIYEGMGGTNVVGKGILAGYVKLMPLDTIISYDMLHPPIMIKIDVEGFETEVLKGMNKVLDYANYVFIEIRRSNYRTVHNILSSKGFRPVKCIDYLTQLVCLYIRQ